jgi:phenylacetate-CoA ligase
MVLNYVRAFIYLQRMLNSAYWSKEKIIKNQNFRLKNIIKYSYDNVPFYHDIMKKKGIYPNDINNLKDLNKMPIISKDHIRKNYHSFISRHYNADNLMQISTSGSTGKPLFLKISDKEDKIRKAKFLRSHISIGHNSRDKWVVITSPHHFGSNSFVQNLLNYYVPYSVSVFDTAENQISKIMQYNADILDGYSSSIYLLAKEIERKNIQSITPKFLIGGAELIDKKSRKYIEDIFEAPFYDQYACIEFERMAWECTEKRGYHIDSDTLVVQFVDENSVEVAPGESGEIICTSLFNYAMPLIRYSVGDLGIPSSEDCTCGRNLPLMKVMEGRTDSLIKLPSERLMSPRSFTVAMSSFRYYPIFDQFRLIQKKTSKFDVLIKLSTGHHKKEVISTELIKYLRKTLSLDENEIDIEVEFVEEIPLDKSGKLKIVISEVNNNKKDERYE